MLLTRFMPCLLLLNGSLVKTVGFKDPAYIGDPINAIRIYNELEVDELVFLDIMATVEGLRPRSRPVGRGCRSGPGHRVRRRGYGRAPRRSDQARRRLGGRRWQHGRVLREKSRGADQRSREG